MSLMDLSEDEQPLFKKDDGSLSLAQHHESDSEDDFGLSSMADQDTLDHLNISSNIKDILRLGNFDSQVGRSLQDDSESDDDSLLGQSHQVKNRIDINKLNQELELTKHKFKDFGDDTQEQEHQETEKKPKKSRKPKEKKRKRPRKVQEDIEEPQDNDHLDRILQKFREESDSDDNKRKRGKKSGRRTRKKQTKPLVDENGEPLYRTTELLEDSSSSEDEKRLSKKEEMEMHRENERLRRSAQVQLKPVYNVKSFDDLLHRRKERQDTVFKNKMLVRHIPSSPIKREASDSDSDIEIINDPRKIAASLVSPERSRYPPNWSPIRPITTSLRDHNRRMLSRMTNESYQLRIKMEQAAKAKGRFTTPTERARQLLQREKDAIMINEQVNTHFEKNKEKSNDDENYQEEEDQPEDDLLNELSGSEEEDDDEFGVEDMNDHKSEQGNKDEEDEDEDMAFVAFKRWKNKKIKKSIFEDEEEEEEQKNQNKTSKPAPAHSIASFFKKKEADTKEDNKEPEDVEEKPLSRLTRRASIDLEDEDIMDIDQEQPVKKKSKPPSKPKEKSEYLEEEAVESEDEFFGAGGMDEEEGEDLDEYEKDDLLVEHNDENVDEAALRKAFNQLDQEKDKHMIQRLMTDIAGGGLRKQKAAAEAGFILDDIDLYDDVDNDLIAIRRAAAARRRRLLKSKGGDGLENLLNDPKTAAFAKAAQVISDEVATAFLDDGEEQDVEEKEEQEPTNSTFVKRIIKEDEEEEEEEDLTMDFSDEDVAPIVEEFEHPIMISPLRAGEIVSHTMNENEDFQIETMQSPITVIKAKSIFSSPSNSERFKRLISETASALNGNTSETGGPRVGFGSLQRNENNKPTENITRNMGSIGELFTADPTHEDRKQSKLKSLSRKKDLFQ